MKEEVKRILKMVQEGKISAEDAAELMEAFEESEKQEAATQTQATAEPEDEPRAKSQWQSESSAGKDPFRAFVDTMERFGRDVTESVDWEAVKRQVKVSAKQGIDSLRVGLESVRDGTGWSFLGSGELKEVTLPLALESGKKLTINNPYGNVRVRGGDTPGSVHARAIFRGVDAEQTKARAKDYTPIVEEGIAGISILQPDEANLTVDLDISVPFGTQIQVKTENGDTWVENTKASVDLNARSGDVSLVDVEGVVNVHVISGDISIQSSPEVEVRIENRSGDVSLREVGGSLAVKTSSGDVSAVESTFASITVETMSGDVDLQATQSVEGTFDLRAVSGDISIAIPDGGSFRASLSALRGDITCDFPLDEKFESEQRVTGRSGEGVGRLDVSTVNGDISLTLLAAKTTSG